MRWENKAKIMSVCANLPGGASLYKSLQKNFGRLDGDPSTRIGTQIEMAQWLRSAGISIRGKTFCEVGTGHKPIIPIGFFLCGAESVITFDLNRRIDFGLTRKVLTWINEHRDTLEPQYRELSDGDGTHERFDLVRRLSSNPQAFLSEANIQYMAPADAARTGLTNGQIDCHFSASVMEHIPADVIIKIFTEAKRVLAKDGTVLHFIDPSDHFQHDCDSITMINFLRFTDHEWSRLAGNQFAYCNRLRASDYQKIFDDLGFEVTRREATVDPESMASLEHGFVPDKSFSRYSAEDLCVTDLKVMMRAR